MENIHLISFNDSVISKSDINSVKSWDSWSLPKLKTIKKPFLIFSSFDELQKNKEEIHKLKELKFLKGIILSVEPTLFTISGSWLLGGLSKVLLDKIHTINDSKMAKRIAHAWKIGAEKDLIAGVTIDDDKNIFLMGCDFNCYKCNASEFKSINGLSLKKLIDFEIDEFGNFIEWDDADIHLNIHSFRAKVDTKYQREVLKEELKHYQNLGDKMFKFRKKMNLNQTDFELSDRQIRRFEKGEEIPSYKSLEKIAAKYELSLEEYLEQVYLLD